MMSGFFERPKIGRPVMVALAGVLVLAVLAVAIVLAYRAGRDSDESPNTEVTDPGSNQASGLDGADEVYDPLVIVDGAEYNGELYIFRGFEQSYIGAVSAAVTWLRAYGSSLDPDYSERLGEELLAEDASQAPSDWRNWPENRREDLGLPATGEPTDGYGLNATPMAYQTNITSDTEVEVVLLVRLTGTSPYGSTTVNTVLSMDLVWTGEDWADAGYDSGVNHSDLEVDIGEENSNLAKTLGWHQLAY